MEDQQQYDKREVSYARTFTNPVQAGIIRTLERMTGKTTLLRMVQEYEALGEVPRGAFFAEALRVMGIDVKTPAEELARIPATGPVVVVANHPHGLVDGMVLGRMIGSVRDDFKILTRSVLVGVDEVDPYLIPVPFPHEERALEKGVTMRQKARTHLADGGLVAIFPAGVVATSPGWFGPAVEREWHAFTAKLCKRSGATVVPVWFRGQNSRSYQWADRVSATLRQGLLLREVVQACGKAQCPVVGRPIESHELAAAAGDNATAASWLREQTISLRADQREPR